MQTTTEMRRRAAIAAFVAALALPGTGHAGAPAASTAPAAPAPQVAPAAPLPPPAPQASPAPGATAAPAALCAAAPQAAEVRRLLAEPRANYWGVAGKLGTSEAAVLSAVAAERGAATAGDAFLPVWESLRAWPEAVAIVMKGGHVFEVHGKIAAGEPSKVSRYFNLQGHEGLSGHLRPDLVAGIYAVELPGRTGPEYGIAFADESGGVAFVVYAPAGDEFTAEGLKAWQATRELIASRAPLCTAS
jgi:putative heme iron utilization protein